MGKNYELVSGIENLKVSYARIENNQIIWHNVSGDTHLGTLDTSALKFSFTINDKGFIKIVLLNKG